MNNPCEHCVAVKFIHDSLSCNSDCLHNAFEELKVEIAKSVRMKYEPKFKCHMREEAKKQHDEWLYADIDTIIDCYSESECDT